METMLHEMPRQYSAEDVATAITPGRARELIERALTQDFDPADDPARFNTSAGAGHLLLMPSTIGKWSGIKVASVGPQNPSHGRPRIQATYILMDSLTLSPQAIMEGSLLTALRTPAVSASAVQRLAAPEASSLLVFGTGPQAWGHVQAIAEIRELREIMVSGRNRTKVDSLIDQIQGLGLSGRPAQEQDVSQADIIVCATSAADPLFDGSLVKNGAAVVAIGSHEPEYRELDSNLMARSLVVVEDVKTALREAGDLIQAMAEDESLTSASLRTLGDLVRGNVQRATDRPNVFKGTGMSWQDLAVAVGVHDHS